MSHKPARYEGWEPITPVMGEVIPDGARWFRKTLKGAGHWCKPQTLTFLQHHLRLEWRVPVEVVSLDTAVEMILCNAIIDGVPSHCGREIVADSLDDLRIAVAEALRKADAK